MSETDEFLETMVGPITEAETALHNGDARRRIAMWSRTDPLTLFGAGMNGRGWDEIGPAFDRLEQQCTATVTTCPPTSGPTPTDSN